MLYTGTEVYKGAISIAEAFEDPQLFYKSLGTPFLINIKDESDSKILQDGKAALVELLLRQGIFREFCEFLEHHPEIVLLIYESSYVIEAILYILARDGHTPVEVLKKTPNLDSQTKAKIMSGLQRMIQQGEKRGMQVGEKRGMQQGEKRGIQIGEKRGMQIGEKKGIMKLVKAGMITKQQAERILKSK